MVDVHDREYDKEHCWQYDIRLKNLEEDIKLSGLPEDEIKNLKASDFELDAFYTQRR